MNKLVHAMLMAAGCFGFAAGVSPAVKLGRTLLSTGTSPVESTVANAGTSRWVTLTDARLRCEKRAVYKDAMTFFLASDASLANPFVAQFLGVVTCEAAQAKISGAFVPEPMTLADLGHYGIDSGGATGLRLFTPLATPKYLRLAVLPFVAIMLLGAAIALFGLRGLLRRPDAGA
jgi:hypothetical protein